MFRGPERCLSARGTAGTHVRVRGYISITIDRLSHEFARSAKLAQEKHTSDPSLVMAL